MRNRIVKRTAVATSAIGAALLVGSPAYAQDGLPSDGLLAALLSEVYDFLSRLLSLR